MESSNETIHDLMLTQEGWKFSQRFLHIALFFSKVYIDPFMEKPLQIITVAFNGICWYYATTCKNVLLGMQGCLYFHEGDSTVMVSLTDSAVRKFKEVVEKQGTSEDGVRIFVVPGG